ncbi:MAG: hypothetical protein ABL997_17180 [Planctomycetota bacterium]
MADPYTVANGPNIAPGQSYSIVLNRMWLRYLDAIEADTLIYVEIYESPSKDPTFAKVVQHRRGMPQGAFTGQTDLTLWGPVTAVEHPVRMALYVFELDPKEDKALFDSVVNATAALTEDTFPSVAKGMKLIGDMLLSLRSDSIDLAYDVTFAPGSTGTANLWQPATGTPQSPSRALPLAEATYAVIKGEGGYRSAKIPDWAIAIGVPFNWAGTTVSSDSQKREIAVDNDDIELFQYGRYGNESPPNVVLGYVGETVYSLVRIPFFLIWAPFRRFYTRDPGTALEQVQWRNGELQLGIAAGDEIGEPYTEKSWMVFSIVRAQGDFREALIEAKDVRKDELGIIQPLLDAAAAIAKSVAELLAKKVTL